MTQTSVDLAAFAEELDHEQSGTDAVLYATFESEDVEVFDTDDHSGPVARSANNSPITNLEQAEAFIAEHGFRLLHDWAPDDSDEDLPRFVAEVEFIGHPPPAPAVADPLSPTIDEVAAVIMREIGVDIGARRLPTTIRTFTDLHDHVDVHHYGASIITAMRAAGRYGWPDSLAQVQARVDLWLRAGRPTEGAASLQTASSSHESIPIELLASSATGPRCLLRCVTRP